MDRPTTRSNGPGFTMVELLVVIVIIALLLALLLPSINGAVRQAQNAGVSAEINQLAQALADFKSKYGDYPPSRIILSENGVWDTSATGYLPGTNEADIASATLAQRSVAYIRKFWPRVATSTDPNSPIFGAGAYPCYDFNGNGKMDTPASYILQGHECLVFFLGGIPTTGGVSGFARNPNNPFLPDTPSIPTASNRQPPLFEFKTDRLAPDPNSISQIPSYFDSLGTNRFYAYFSAYGGNSYDPNDVNFDSGNNVESDVKDVGPITLAFHVTFPVQLSGVNGNTPQIAVSAPPNPYTSTRTLGLTSPTTPGPVTYQNPNSFQIISAGADGEYGVGGQYSPSAQAPLQFDTYPPYSIQPDFMPNGSSYNSADPGLRTREKDNLTNFSNGRLD